MGVVNGSLKAVLTWQKADQKCLPHYQYQPFPQFLLQNQGRGGLLLELNAIPTGLGKQIYHKRQRLKITCISRSQLKSHFVFGCWLFLTLISCIKLLLYFWIITKNVLIPSCIFQMFTHQYIMFSYENLM